MPTPNPKECPVCDTELPPGVFQCPKCKNDLSKFSPELDVAIDHYNQGLDCADNGDRNGAINKMIAAIESDPEMIDAHIVLGKLYAQAGDSEETKKAIEYWKRAKNLHPTPDESRNIEACLNVSQTALARIEKEKQQQRRKKIGGVVLAGLGLASIFGLGGFFLNNRQNPSDKVASKLPDNSSRSLTDPVIAAKQAISRPDIAISKQNGILVLAGVASNQAEKKAIVNAAHFASNLKVNSSGIRVKEALPAQMIARNVTTEQVRSMLQNYVAGSASSDPLHGARLKVSGGEGKPLKITGICYNDRGGMKSANLIRAIFPKVDKVDTSGLEFRAAPLSKSSRIASARKNSEIAVIEKPSRKRISKLTRKSSETKARESKAKEVFKLKERRRQERLALAKEKHALAKRKKSVETGVEERTANAHKSRIAQKRSRETGVYRVRPGDTLYSIARKFGRNPSDWKTLWKMNYSDVIDSSSLSEGTVLTLPVGWYKRGER